MLQNVFQSYSNEKPNLTGSNYFAGITNMVLDAVLVGVLRWGVLERIVNWSKPDHWELLFYSVQIAKKLHLTKLNSSFWARCTGLRHNGSSELDEQYLRSVVEMFYNFQLLKYS